MKPLVVRASELGIDLLAELARMLRGNMRVEGFPVLPDFYDGDVIAARNFRAGFHSHDAWVLARIGNILLDQFCAGRRLGRDDIDVRDDVNLVLRSRLLSQHPPRQPAGDHK